MTLGVVGGSSVVDQSVARALRMHKSALNVATKTLTPRSSRSAIVGMRSAVQREDVKGMIASARSNDNGVLRLMRSAQTVVVAVGEEATRRRRSSFQAVVVEPVRSITCRGPIDPMSPGKLSWDFFQVRLP